MKLTIRIDDDEARALWETAKKAKAEVESWPDWKHNEVPRAFSDAPPRVWSRRIGKTEVDVARPVTHHTWPADVMGKWSGAVIWRWSQPVRDEVVGVLRGDVKRIFCKGARDVVRRKRSHAE